MADIFSQTEQRRKKGKALAEANRARIVKEVKTRDRFQSGVPFRNMIKALEIHPWQNTVTDWQRYYEAKIVQAARRKPSKKKTVKRKNPCGTKRKNPRRSTTQSGPWTLTITYANGKKASKTYKTHAAAKRASTIAWNKLNSTVKRTVLEATKEDGVRTNPRAKAKYGVFKLTPSGRQYILSHTSAAQKKAELFGFDSWASATNYPVEFPTLQAARLAAKLAKNVDKDKSTFWAERLKKGGF